MAFNRNDLARTSSSGNTNAPASWNYTTTDTFATVAGTDYFLLAIRELQLNDNITLTTSTGTTAVVTKSYIGTNDGTTIDVATGLTVTA